MAPQPKEDSEDDPDTLDAAVLNEPTEDEAVDEVMEEAFDGALDQVPRFSTRACLGLSPRELTRDVMRLCCCRCLSPSPVVSYVRIKGKRIDVSIASWIGIRCCSFMSGQSNEYG